jgi:hypothetical protein
VGKTPEVLVNYLITPKSIVTIRKGDSSLKMIATTFLYTNNPQVNLK